MAKQKKLVLEIGIAAYNAEKNIGQLINSLLLQKNSNFVLNKITVYSDSSSDKTSSIVNKYRQKVIQLIDADKRTGFAQVVKILIRNNKSDVLLIVNDDIKIQDRKFVDKMIKPFIIQKEVGLVCGNPQPLTGKTFVEKALNSRFRADEKVRYYLKDGHNNFTCDGKTLAFSRQFIDSLYFPADRSKVGNVDAYLYFSCLNNGFLYRHVKNAIVYFRNASSVNDYIKWISRNNSNKGLLKEKFGELVEKEYKKPLKELLRFSFIEFIKNPLGGLFILITEIYITSRLEFFNNQFSATWETLKSTKDLNS